jgi:IS1 family transposase
MSARFETKESPISKWTWVVWDNNINNFVLGSRDKREIDRMVETLNTPLPTVPPTGSGS